MAPDKRRDPRGDDGPFSGWRSLPEYLMGIPGRAAAIASGFWEDPDKRRALAISVVLHLLILLLFLLVSLMPRPEPVPPYIVIDVGTPAFAETESLAPTVEEAAVPAVEPQVASEEIGDPRDLAADTPEVTAEEPEERTAQPAAPAAAPAETVQEPTPEPQVEEVVEAPSEPTPEPATEPVEVVEAAPQEAPAPVLEAPTQASQPESSLPLAEAPAVQLPEIDAVVLDPRTLENPISLPEAEPAAQVAETRDVDAQPTVEVSEARDVTEAQPTATVGESREVAAPTAAASTRPATDLSGVAPSATVADARPVSTPAPSADVAETVQLTEAAVSAAVSGHTPLAPPATTSVVGNAREVSVQPDVVVAQARDVAVPSFRAQESEATSGGAPSTDATIAGTTDVQSPLDSPRQPGGNAISSGQTGPLDPDASAAGRGLAASPEGEGDGTGAPPPPSRRPFEATRRRPLAVLLDNANGYPQQGLSEASMIVELPVEGGITRLMPLYDSKDPARVGPVRSARDYFVTVARFNNAVLVHDGGSPSALIDIQNTNAPTLNAYSSGELFDRSADRSAPYNLYSSGAELRSAAIKIAPGGSRAVNTTVFAPAEDDDRVRGVDVPYGTYSTGFAYDDVLDRYRWVRNGSQAAGSDGQPVLVQAVLVGEVVAEPIPGDTAGRLYVPVDRGGRATLYLQGRATRGSWELAAGSGIRFRTDEGEIVELAPFRTWVVLLPSYDRRVEQ